jgi:site-specific DNA-methyltransferase (adenine-specific)
MNYIHPSFSSRPNSQEYRDNWAATFAGGEPEQMHLSSVPMDQPVELRHSGKVDWETPKDLFHDLSAEFGPFDIDVAASNENALCDEFYDEEVDGLANSWNGRVWCNPPYGRAIGKWAQKAVHEIGVGRASVVVMLLPARTDTRWFHEYVKPHADEIRFLCGRLKFSNAENPAPFPSMVVIFRDKSNGQAQP